MCGLAKQKRIAMLNPNKHWHRASLEAEDPTFLTKPKQRTKLFRFISLLSFANALICALTPAASYPIKVEMFEKQFSCKSRAALRFWCAL